MEGIIGDGAVRKISSVLTSRLAANAVITVRRRSTRHSHITSTLPKKERLRGA